MFGALLYASSNCKPRYARVHMRCTDDAVTSFAQVMCLFCEEEPASEQEPAVHRRDRFCSVECMEVRCTT